MKKFTPISTNSCGCYGRFAAELILTSEPSRSAHPPQITEVDL